ELLRLSPNGNRPPAGKFAEAAGVFRPTRGGNCLPETLPGTSETKRLGLNTTRRNCEAAKPCSASCWNTRNQRKRAKLKKSAFLGAILRKATFGGTDCGAKYT